VIAFQWKSYDNEGQFRTLLLSNLDQQATSSQNVCATRIITGNQGGMPTLSQ